MKRSTFYLSISLLILALPAVLFAVTGGTWLESGSGAASSSLGRRSPPLSAERKRPTGTRLPWEWTATMPK